jgi:polysaccharide export outer membrane protein
MPDFKTDVRVNSGGEISLPMLGTVAVSGLSVEQAETLIARKLSEKGLFNDPHVTVFEKEYATQGISVLGEVQKPGIYPLLGSRKLFDAISAAGGTTPKAGRYALITRRNDPQHPVQVPLLTGSSDAMQNNVVVEPGDTISLQRLPIRNSNLTTSCSCPAAQGRVLPNVELRRSCKWQPVSRFGAYLEVIVTAT